MRTIENLLSGLETGCMDSAPAHSHEMLVSGKTVVTCSQDNGVITWTVDNRLADRETAGRALAFARAHRYARFADFHPQKV